MKECQFCSAENSDGAIYCISCGKRLDGKIVCPSCGGLTPSNGTYCEVCGARVDGKVVCECGALVEGNYCLNCGKPSPKLKYKPASRSQLKAAYAATDSSSVALWQKIVKIASASVAMLGVLFALIFVSFIGVKAKVGDNGISSSYVNVEINENIWYYFGSIYSDISSTLDSTLTYSGQFATTLYVDAIIGTVTVALILIGVVVGAIVSVVSFVKYLTGKSDKFNYGAAIFTVAAFVAGCAAFMSLNYAAVVVKKSTVSGGTQRASVVFNGATNAGIWLSAISLLLAFSGNVVSDGKRSLRSGVIVKSSCALGAAIFAIVALTALSKTTVLMKVKQSGYNVRASLTPETIGGLFAASMTEEGNAEGIYGKENAVIVVGIIAQVLIIAALVIIPFAISKIGNLDKTSNSGAVTLSSVFAAVVAGVLVCTIVTVVIITGLAKEGSPDADPVTVSVGAGVIVSLIFGALTIAASAVGGAFGKKVE